MKALPTLALVTLLASSTVVAGSTPGQSLAKSPFVPAATSARLAQHHGTVSRPRQLCGYRITVAGIPGTTYTVYGSVAGLAPTVVDLGTIPPGGVITKAISSSGCEPQEHTLRVRVTSHADDRIAVRLEYF